MPVAMSVEYTVYIQSNTGIEIVGTYSSREVAERVVRDTILFMSNSNNPCYAATVAIGERASAVIVPW